MKKILLVILICILKGSLTLNAQNVTWTSSHPLIVSVDANGSIKMISEPATTTDVTITQTTTQNGKTVTATKKVQVDACTSCFSWKAPNDSQARTYCGVRYNGLCWIDRNIGSSRLPTSVRDTAGYGIQINPNSTSAKQCPSGWSLPTGAQWASMLSAATGKTITANTWYYQVVSEANTLFNCPLRLVPSGYSNYSCSGISSQVEYWYAVNGTPDNLKLAIMITTIISIRVITTSYSFTNSIRCIKN